MNHEHIAQLGHSYGISSGQLLFQPCPRGDVGVGAGYSVSFRGIVDKDAIMHVGFRANLNRTRANSRKAMLRSRGASPGNLGTKRLLWKQIARFK